MRELAEVKKNQYDEPMKIGVYGLGRFGYFWASVLAGNLPSEQFSVLAYNRSKEKPTPDGVIRCSLEELMSADAVFLCVSISSLEGVLDSISDMVSEHTLIIDTCSVKSYPVSLMESMLKPETHYLATHPMFGPDSGKNGVAGLPLVFCSGRCPKELEDIWFALLSSLKLEVIRMSAEEHDREAAFTQGITHFIGRVLKEIDLPDSRIGTVGYQSLQKIIQQTCNDPLQLFYDLQRYNPYTHDMRLALRDSLDKTMQILSKADEDGESL